MFSKLCSGVFHGDGRQRGKRKDERERASVTARRKSIERAGVRGGGERSTHFHRINDTTRYTGLFTTNDNIYIHTY